MEYWGDVMSRHHLNYIVLFDGNFFRVFERLGKDVPFEAYNPMKHLGKGLTFNEAISNSSVPVWEIEDYARDVVFNE